MDPIGIFIAYIGPVTLYLALGLEIHIISVDETSFVAFGPPSDDSTSIRVYYEARILQNFGKLPYFRMCVS